jgi:hypothetical protein
MSQTKAQLVNDVRPNMALGNNHNNAVMNCDTDVQLQIFSTGHAQLKIQGDASNVGTEDKEARIILGIDGPSHDYASIRLGNYGEYWSGSTNNDNTLILSCSTTGSNHGGIVLATTVNGNDHLDSIPRVRVPNSGGIEIYGEVDGTGSSQVHRTVKLTGISVNNEESSPNKTTGLFLDSSSFFRVATGTEAQRPTSPAAGYMRFNTTSKNLEIHDGTAWASVGIVAPTVSNFAIASGLSVFNLTGGETVTLTGGNFSSVPTIVLIAEDGTEFAATSESFTSTTSMTFVTPNVSSKAPGAYDLKLTNPDGGTVTKTDFITSSGVPVWTTAAGTIVDQDEGTSVNFTLAATDSDGGAITYAVTTGSLPSGISLNASTGVISGTLPAVNADTNTNFSVTATDNENQTTARAFTITIRDIYVMGSSSLFNG